MEKILRKSVAPYYGAAAVWVLCALLLPLYTAGMFLLTAVLSVAAFLLLRAVCKDVEVPQPAPEKEKPKEPENPELQKMLSDGEMAIREMRRLNESITDEKISAAIDKLEELYGRALREGISGPELYAVQNWIVNTQGKIISAAICGFTAHYNEIMEGSYREDLFFGTDMEPLVWALGNIAYRYVFTSKPIYKLEIAAEVIISNLFDKFINAVLYFDTDEHSKERLLEELKDETLLEGLEEKKDSGDKNEKRPGMSAVDEKLISLISENYMNVYKRCSEGKSESEKLYLRLMLVTDYICGMTDSFAKTLYQELNAVI